MVYSGANTYADAAREGTIANPASFSDPSVSTNTQTRRVFGILQRDVNWPDRDQEYFRHKSIGAGRQYFRQTPTRVSFGPAALPIIPLNGFPIYFAMGREICTGTASGASTTLSSAALPGASSISVASGTGIANGDTIQIGAGDMSAGTVSGLDTSPAGLDFVTEVATVLSGGGTTTLTLTAPISHEHANGASILRVVAPFTHAFQRATRARKPAFTARAICNIERDESSQFLRRFVGTTIGSFELSGDDPSGDGGWVTLNTQISAYDIIDDDATPASTPTVATFPNADPYMFYNVTSSVSAFGATIGTIERFRLTFDDKLHEKRYFGPNTISGLTVPSPNAARPGHPSMLLTAFPDDYEFEMDIVPNSFFAANDSIWNTLRTKAVGNVTIPFLRDNAASFSASTDAFQINLIDCVVKTAPAAFNEERQEIMQPARVLPESFYLLVKDSTPMYAAV